MSSIAGNVFTYRTVLGEILLDSYGAHDRVGCIVVVKIESDISVGSTIQVKFADYTSDTNPKLKFSGANTFINATSVEILSLSKSLSKSTIYNSNKNLSYVRVDAAILSQSASSCYWSSSNSSDETLNCLQVFQSTVKILLKTFIPGGSIIALKLDGKLRNPSRPGLYSWPLDAVQIFQWDQSVSDNLKSLTADHEQANNPAQLTMISNGLILLIVNISSGLLASPSMKILNPTVNQSTNIEFSFVSESSVFTTDLIVIVVPKTFSLFDTGGSGPVLSIIGPVKGLPGTLAIKNISHILGSPNISCQITLTRCSDAGGNCYDLVLDSGLDQQISFTLGPFLSRQFAGVNFNQEIEAGNLFGLYVIDILNNVIEGSGQDFVIFPTDFGVTFSGSYPGPPLLPRSLQATLQLGSNKSADITNASILLLPSRGVTNDSELFLFLPPLFGIVGTPNVSLYKGGHLLDQTPWKEIRTEYLKLEGVYKSAKLVSSALRIRPSEQIDSGIWILATFSGILNSIGGSVPTAPTFTLAIAKGCSNISAMSCYWLTDLGILVGGPVDAGEIKNASIRMSSLAAGNHVMLQVQFTTSNPFPVMGKVEIDLPEGYSTFESLQICSDILSIDRKCPLSCS
jgi:hypothetical protein